MVHHGNLTESFVLAYNVINVPYEFENPHACPPCEAYMKVLVLGHASHVGTDGSHHVVL